MADGDNIADVVIVGSGINALVCGATLAMKGCSVLLLERNAVAGGCIRTEELTLPGFHHDTLSTLYPLFVTAPHYATLGPALERHGLRFVNTRFPTALLGEGGSPLSSPPTVIAMRRNSRRWSRGTARPIARR